MNVFADDHASCVVIGELWIERVAKLGEKLHRGIQVLYRQVDEYVFMHEPKYGINA